jgi:hypothetical protein
MERKFSVDFLSLIERRINAPSFETIRADDAAAAPRAIRDAGVDLASRQMQDYN